MKRSPLRKVSKRKLAILLKNAIRVFNAWIRDRDKKRLRGKCYTCGGKGTQAGHFRHSANSVRFNEKNVNLQCVRCNKYLSGNLGIYAIKLVEEYGKQEVDNLIRLSWKTKQHSEKELLDVIKRYSLNIDFW